MFEFPLIKNWEFKRHGFWAEIYSQMRLKSATIIDQSWSSKLFFHPNVLSGGKYIKQWPRISLKSPFCGKFVPKQIYGCLLATKHYSFCSMHYFTNNSWPRLWSLKISRVLVLLFRCVNNSQRNHTRRNGEKNEERISLKYFFSLRLLGDVWKKWLHNAW